LPPKLCRNLFYSDSDGIIFWFSGLLEGLFGAKYPVLSSGFCNRALTNPIRVSTIFCFEAANGYRGLTVAGFER
jgi:hypothetical protein